jgi:hypothetical protein
MANQTTPVIQVKDSNVGIGTVSPGAKLVVSGSAVEAHISNGDTNTLTLGNFSGGRHFIKSINLGVALTPLTLQASSFTFDTGNVGIGTTSPAEKLHAIGNIKIEQTSNVSAILTLNPNSGALGTGYQWNLVGVNSAASYAFQIREAATAYLHINNSAGGSGGNVGIGTTSPGYKFTVNESTTNPIAYFGLGPSNASSRNSLIVLQSGTIPQNGSDTTGEAGFLFKHSYGTGGVNGTANGGYIESIRESVFGITSQVNTALVFGTSSANTDGERMRISSAGNVGIGTTSPTEKLAVNGNIETTSPAGKIGFDVGDAYGDYPHYGLGKSSGALPVNLSGYYGLTFGTEGSEKVRILGNGNVGIGTTSPSEKLFVNVGAGALMNSTITYGTNTKGIVINQDDGGSYGAGLWFRQSGLTAGIGSVRVNSGDWATDLRFYTHPSAIVNQNELYERMRINSEGNVGIGTTSPSRTLHVAGTTRHERVYAYANNVFPIANNVALSEVWLHLGTQGAFTTDKIYYRVGTNTSEEEGEIVVKNTCVKPNIEWNRNSYNVMVTAVKARMQSGCGACEIWIRVRYGSNYGGANTTVQWQVHNGTDASFTTVNATGTPGTGTNESNISSTDGYFVANSDNLAVIGNVGIGTTSPDAKLVVVGSGTGVVKIGDAGFGSGNYTGISLNGTLSSSNYNILSSPTDSTLYINRPTGATIQFRENNTTQVIIAASGNVGIGTTSPAAKLHLTGEFETNYALQISGTYGTGRTFGWKTNGGNSDVLSLYDVNSTNRMAFFGNNEVGLQTQGSIRLYINSTGNVGIGTTAPYGRLELNGSGQSWTTAPAIRMWDSFNAKGWLVGNVNNITAGDFYIRTLPSVNGAPGTGQQEFTIKHATGNVGIGTTSPSQILSISRAATDNYIKVEAGSTVSNYSGLMLTEYGINWGWALRHNAATDLLHISYQDNTPTFSDSVTFNRNGNVGIGTTTPSYKLDVVGDARITSGSLGVGVAPNATDGRIDASNDIVAYQTSDQRLKENVTPIENALEKVKSLTGVEFDWIEEHKHIHGYEGHDTGVIAQQVQAVMPTAVRTNDSGYLSVRYEKMIALLIEGMKEQQKQIDELKSKLK